MGRAKQGVKPMASPTSSEVYDGRHRLGFFVDLGRKVAAQLADGTDLGAFPNRDAATHAVIQAARARQGAGGDNCRPK